MPALASKQGTRSQTVSSKSGHLDIPPESPKWLSSILDIAKVFFDAVKQVQASEIKENPSLDPESKSDVAVAERVRASKLEYKTVDKVYYLNNSQLVTC